VETGGAAIAVWASVLAIPACMTSSVMFAAGPSRVRPARTRRAGGAAAVLG
jgi:hypothetical protein